MVAASEAREPDAYRDVFLDSSENPLQKTANVLELRRGPPKTSKLPQSIQSPEGVDLIPSRDGRIRTGDPLNPITLRLYAKSREMPGFSRVLEKISWNRDPHFQASRGVT